MAAGTCSGSKARPDAGQIYNVCDDNPAPPEEVLCYAADLLGMPHPARIDYETAVLPEMVRSFYAESKRVSNAKIKSALGVTLRYPTYQAGLQALLKSSQAGQ